MASQLVIGVHLGPDSVSAAFKLAGKKQDPIPITWDKAGKQTEAPVWVRHNADDDDPSKFLFPWSKVPPNTNIAAHGRDFLYYFLLTPHKLAVSIVDILRKRHGKRQVSDSDELPADDHTTSLGMYLRPFLRSFMSYIYREIIRVFPETTVSGDRVIIIDTTQVPSDPHPQVREVIQSEWGGPGVTIRYVLDYGYPPSLAWSLSPHNLAMGILPGSILVLFHVGRHYSFIQTYGVVWSRTQKTEIYRTTEPILLVTGSMDIANQLGLLVGRKCTDAVSQMNDVVCGMDIVKAIESVQEDFLLTLPTRVVTKSTVIKMRLKCLNVTTTKTMPLSLTVTPDDWKEVFDPTLDNLLGQLNKHFCNIPSKQICMHPSGPLFECDYVSKYFESRLPKLPSAPSLLQATDEGLAASFGAASFLDGPRRIEIVGPPFKQKPAKVVPIPSPLSISSWMNDWGEGVRGSKYSMVHLYTILQRDGCCDVEGNHHVSAKFSAFFNTVVDFHIKSSPGEKPVEQLANLASTLCQTYFDERTARVKRAGRGASPAIERLIPASRRKLWAQRNNKLGNPERPDLSRLDGKAFWISPNEGDSQRCLKIARYMMLARDMGAFEMVAKTCAMASVLEEIANPSEPENILSMAIMTDFWDGLEAAIDAGADWSHGLYWAIYWHSEDMVRRITKMPGLSLDRFIHGGWIGLKKSPLELAIRQGHAASLRVLLSNGASFEWHHLLGVVLADDPDLKEELSSYLRKTTATNCLIWMDIRYWFSILAADGRDAMSSAHRWGVKNEEKARTQVARAITDALKQHALEDATRRADHSQLFQALLAGADPYLAFVGSEEPIHVTSQHRHIFDEAAEYIRSGRPETIVASPLGPPRSDIQLCKEIMELFTKIGCTVRLDDGQSAWKVDRLSTTTSPNTTTSLGIAMSLGTATSHNTTAGSLGISSHPGTTSQGGPADSIALDSIWAAVQKLFEGSDIDKKKYPHLTPLTWAIISGHEDVVPYLLLKSSINVNQEDGSGWALLFWAIQAKNEAIVRRLLEKGSDIEKRGLSRAKSVFSQLLRYPVEYAWPGIRAHVIRGKTPLHFAIEIGHPGNVAQLLDCGANIEARERETPGRTPLMLAAHRGEDATARLLLDKGADIEARDKFGYTALMYAADNGHRDVVGTLLDRGADIEARDELRRTALMFAAQKGHEAAVQRLLDQGADIEVQDAYGRTPPLLAARNRHRTVALQLLENGVESKTKEGTAWNKAVEDFLDKHLTVADRWLLPVRIRRTTGDQ